MEDKDKLIVMAQAIKALEEERDFLRQTVLKLSSKKDICFALLTVLLNNLVITEWDFFKLPHQS